MKAMMKANHDKMSSMQMMGNTDMDFAMMMRVHHKGTIDMAEAELRDGQSTLTCPECGHAKTETMPTDACQWFYECEMCHIVLRPKPGDCCVYCSFGTMPCPPIQTVGEAGGLRPRALIPVKLAHAIRR